MKPEPHAPPAATTFVTVKEVEANVRTRMDKALIGGEYEGFIKVVADKMTDELLGVHMVGPHVTDLISEASTAMLLEATAWEVGAAVHPHPTLSETLNEAALAVDGKSINF